jgi:large subunit ribosomal protein L31
MKANIHPNYHTITVKMTDGTTYQTRSTWGKEGDVLQLDVDPKTHPAWVGGAQLRKTGQMEKFNNKFAFLEAKGSMEVKGTAQAATPKAAAPKAEAKAEPKAAAPKKKEDKKS